MCDFHKIVVFYHFFSIFSIIFRSSSIFSDFFAEFDFSEICPTPVNEMFFFVFFHDFCYFSVIFQSFIPYYCQFVNFSYFWVPYLFFMPPHCFPLSIWFFYYVNQYLLSFYYVSVSIFFLIVLLITGKYFSISVWFGMHYFLYTCPNIQLILFSHFVSVLIIILTPSFIISLCSVFPLFVSIV